MSNTYKISWDKIRQGHLKEAFAALEACFSEAGIDFYLIGAVARDIWLTGLHDIKSKRITKDVDWAVLVPTPEVYQELKQKLVDSGDFTPSRENNYVLIYKDGTSIDLLPFGEVETEGRVTVEGPGMTSIRVDGFQEVYESGTQWVTLEEMQPFKVCTLPGIVILKLVAFDDRPEHRQKDIVDITYILENYFSISNGEIFDKHYDLLDENFIEERAAVRLLGRQMQPILMRSTALKERIIRILESNTADAARSPIGNLMIRGTEKTVAEAIVLLKDILAGILDAASSLE
jgi:predicted nucleotidyltransferase